MFPAAFVTTCKGRLRHIKRTSSTIIAESPANVILVDCGCPDNTAAWLKQGLTSFEIVHLHSDLSAYSSQARSPIGAASAIPLRLWPIDASIQLQRNGPNQMHQYEHSSRAMPTGGQPLLETVKHRCHGFFGTCKAGRVQPRSVKSRQGNW